VAATSDDSTGSTAAVRMSQIRNRITPAAPVVRSACVRVDRLRSRPTGSPRKIVAPAIAESRTACSKDIDLLEATRSLRLVTAGRAEL
jgi:hypothetical protein